MIRWYWGSKRSGELRFKIGTYGYVGMDGERVTYQRRKVTPIRGMYGISFGVSAFIGIMAFNEGGETRERIK